MQPALFFDLHAWLAGAALVFARLAPVFFMLPFLNGGVLTGAPRTAVIILTGLALWPSAAQGLPGLDALGFVLLILREVAIGVALGTLLCWPFWVLQGMGNLIDNQRGAMLGSTVDPASGSESSELANFLQMFGAVVYLAAGGMALMLETLEGSYRLCAPDASCRFDVQPLLGFLDPLVAKIIITSAPVVAMLLLSEALLGLLARYTPQLNAFSMSLAVKGPIALIVLLLYFGPYLPGEIQRMGDLAIPLPGWLVQEPR